MTLHTTSLGDSGSRVIFLHGLFGQGRNWTQVGKAFAGDHRVTLVDLPHHGRSPWRESFSYAELADSVAELISADDPVAMVGHSMGGKAAMALALRRPELVERLCVVDIAPVDHAAGSEFAPYVAAMRALDLDALPHRHDAEAALAPAVPDPTVRSFLLQNLRREGARWRWQVNLEVLGRDLAAISRWPPELDRLPAYPGPVLWITGGESNYVRDDHAAAMERLFPRTRRVSVKGAGHWVHSEKPEVFVEVLRGFLGRGAIVADTPSP